MTDDVKFEQNLVVYDVITWLICIFEYLWNEKRYLTIIHRSGGE